MEHRLRPGDRLVVATHNRGKLREFETLLAPYGLGVLLAGDLGLPEPDETGTTFEEDARIKALAAAEAARMPALADDLGVVVEALGGEPGFYSARWAGPEKDFRAAMAKVEEKLEEAEQRPRTSAAPASLRSSASLFPMAPANTTVARSRERWCGRRAAPVASVTTPCSCRSD